MNDSKQSSTISPTGKRILFLTGRLATPSLIPIVQEISEKLEFEGIVETLPINVAALTHVDWIQRRFTPTDQFDQIIVPGWCQGDLEQLSAAWNCPVVRGPKDLRDLPAWFQQKSSNPPDLTRYDIEILAEINCAPLLEDAELIRLASHYRDRGADLIDYGCLPGAAAPQVGHHIRLLKDHGFRVSIDSFDRAEVEKAVQAGAELILSGNKTNRDWLPQLGIETVIIPDDFQELSTWEETIQAFEAAGTPYRLDPIIEPIGFGFAASLLRYHETRQRWPDAPVMMGIGNVTELSEVDSAGVNFLLIAICQEWGIQSILTTEVINWCRESVREIDAARRLVRYAVGEKQLPKHVGSNLLALRDARVHSQSFEELAEIAAGIKDPNYRIFSTEDALHLMNRDGHWSGDDPFALFREASKNNEIDPGHAFYLGYELALAETARQLGKQYIQDEPLQWGADTRTTSRHSLKPTFRNKTDPESTTNDND